MQFSEDDKWYIAETAQSAMMTLISSLDGPGSTEEEVKRYTKRISTMAHLIGFEMFLAREKIFAAIDKNKTKE